MKRTLLSECSWWVKTSSFLYQLELAKAHLTVVDIGIVENTNSNKRIELSSRIGSMHNCKSLKNWWGTSEPSRANSNMQHQYQNQRERRRKIPSSLQGEPVKNSFLSLSEVKKK